MKSLFSIQYILIAVIASVIMGGCRQDFPQDIEGEAALWFRADMPTFKLIEGGKENYELRTDISVGDLGVEEYAAFFRQQGCENCPGQMKMIFRDYKPKEEIGSFDPDSTFFLGAWSYRGQETAGNNQEPPVDPLSFRFAGKSDGTPPFSYEWQFGDGHITNSPNPVHTYGSAGDFEVKLRIQDANGCADQSSHKISVGSNYFVCPYDFTATKLGENKIEFTVKREDGNPFNQHAGFFWDLGFGGGATTFSDSSSFVVQYPFEGIFQVTLLVFDTCGCPCPVTKNVYTGSSPSCVSEIAFKTIPEDKETSRVSLEWTDENGTFYTTNGPNGQPQESKFRMLDREMYKENPQGRQTYKLSATFDCVLYNPSDPTDSIIVRNGQSSFALEIPE